MSCSSPHVDARHAMHALHFGKADQDLALAMLTLVNRESVSSLEAVLIVMLLST